MPELNQNQEPEKLDLSSLDVAGAKRRELVELFPEVRTEGGKIDFERLKTVLGDLVDQSRERYGLNWPGKSDCMRAVQAASMGTLVPCPEQSVDWGTTENLIIEGDNLEVLKLLQKSYLGKVKMIYIDPPYNTGKDFIYPDNFTESLQTYLEFTGQADTQGRRFGINLDTDGRFHSKWLNMLYPRLYLAKNLLSDDGVIFISIDDAEVDNLKKLCNEIFGEENFIACICWQKKQSPQNDATYFSDMHDFVLVYARMAKQSREDSFGWNRNLLPRTATQDERYKNPDHDSRGPWTSVDYTCNKTATERPNLYYPIRNPQTGEEVLPSKQRVWRFDRAAHQKNVSENRLWWGSTGDSFPRLKRFRNEVAHGIVPTTWWTREDAGDNQESRREIRALFGDNEDSFDTPKPTRLIQRMVYLATSSDTGDLILDFFAGSGTTAHSVMKQNMEDGGNRRFILVQLPEKVDSVEFPTISSITRERVRRSAKQLEEKATLLSPDFDHGFRAFSLQQSGLAPWDGSSSHDKEALSRQLSLHIQNVDSTRSEPDLFFEILLKSGFALDSKVESISLGGCTVYKVAEGALLVCLSKKLNMEAIKAMADLTPERVVCLDTGFEGNDQLKTNAVQTFKTKGVTSFKVV